MDLAEAHGACLACRTSWPARDQSTNLGTGQGYSVLDMVAAFTKASSRAVPYRILLRRASDVAACYGRSWESSAELGWRTRRDLSDMCASAWKFQNCDT
jgi:UDP-glucose 4-epimerase